MAPRGQVVHDNMALAHCILENKVYTNTNTVCNTYRFSTAAVVAITRLTVTTYVQYTACRVVIQFRHIDYFLFAVTSGILQLFILLVVIKLSRKVPGSIPGRVTGDFFRGIRQVHVPGVDSAFRNEVPGYSWG
jgi:hypothetical protein